MSRRLVTAVAGLAVALIGAASIARLVSGTTTWRAALVTALAGAVVALVASVRAPTPWSIVAGTVVVAATALWTSVAGTTRDGLPTATTFRALDHALRAVGAVHFPLRSVTGVVFLSCLLAGMAAVATTALPGAFSLAPTLVLVTLSTVALPSRGAAGLAVVFAAAAVVVLVSGSPERVGWQMGTVTTVAAALCVVLVAVVTGPSAASGGGVAVAGVPPTALSLVSRLTELQIRDPDLVLFTASTPVPTYWQVTSLSVLEGGAWVADAATAAALHGGPTPATDPGPSTGRPYTVSVAVDNLSSRLLPVPPSTVSATTGTLTSVGVVTPEPTAPGLRYRATATIPSVNTSSAAAVTAPPGASDTALPALPPEVSTLAHQVTASAPTALDKAEALTNWFRSKLFHYSLRPTATTLVSFLTSSRRGSCEQFAGAYAVLARAVGLPTRVAVGFTTGVRDAAGQTVVRGIDAHAWPEVYLDGTWVSFEPTPEQPSGELSPPGVIGVTAVGTPNPVAPVTIPKSLPKTTLPPPVPPPPTPAAVAPSSSAWWPWAVGGGVFVVALATGVVLRRRRRRRPADELVSAWRRVDRALARRALARPPWRTPLVHTRALRAGAQGKGSDDLWKDLEWLATSLEETTYGHRPVDAELAHQARGASHRVTRALHRSVTV